MAKIGTAHVEIKPVLNEDALQEVTEALTQSIDGALCVTSASLIVAAVRLHEALFRSPDLLGSAPNDVLLAYGDLQDAMKRIGINNF